MDVHLRDLRYFVAVAEQLHFGRAAEGLFVSQPALSKQVRALETQLRVELLVRDRRSVRLTAAGEALLPHARELLAAWAAAETDLGAASAEAAATLVIGMSTAPGRGLLPAIRARLTSDLPQARLRIQAVPRSDPTTGLADAASGTDAAFVWLPLPEPERYRWIEVGVEERVVAVPVDHPLAGRESVAFAELLDEPFLALPERAGPLRAFWLALEARDGNPVRVGAEVATAEETAEAVGAGLGVALVAAGNAPLLARDDVRLRPVSGLPPARLVLAWRSGDDRTLLRALRRAALQAAGRSPRPRRPGRARRC